MNQSSLYRHQTSRREPMVDSVLFCSVLTSTQFRFLSFRFVSFRFVGSLPHRQDGERVVLVCQRAAVVTSVLAAVPRLGNVGCVPRSVAAAVVAAAAHVSHARRPPHLALVGIDRKRSHPPQYAVAVTVAIAIAIAIAVAIAIGNDVAVSVASLPLMRLRLRLGLRSPPAGILKAFVVVRGVPRAGAFLGGVFAMRRDAQDGDGIAKADVLENDVMVVIVGFSGLRPVVPFHR